ncbi:MAG: tetratricopeptide repeat protein [Xanthomonadales bacterium]|nr:tetratricopeptide repeat protein [Xanthomonadales bacterium]
MVVFQVAFGLTVFGFTRHYYISQTNDSGAATATVPHTQMAWPDSTGPDDLEQLMSTFPGQVAVQNPEQTLQRADELFVNGDYVQAGDMYQRLVSSGYRDVNLYNNLGLTLHYLGRSQEALQRLNEGIALDSSYQRIWLTLGYVSSQVGRIDDARVALTTAVEMDADNDIGQSAARMLQDLP